MDISGINDLKQLKAMAYDAIAAKEQIELNLQKINRRIIEVMDIPDQKNPDQMIPVVGE